MSRRSLRTRTASAQSTPPYTQPRGSAVAPSEKEIERVLRASAQFAREAHSTKAILAFYANEESLGELYEELAHLVGVYETELEFGVQGPLEIES